MARVRFLERHVRLLSIGGLYPADGQNKFLESIRFLQRSTVVSYLSAMDCLLVWDIFRKDNTDISAISLRFIYIAAYTGSVCYYLFFWWNASGTRRMIEAANKTFVVSLAVGKKRFDVEKWTKATDTFFTLWFIVISVAGVLNVALIASSKRAAFALSVWKDHGLTVWTNAIGVFLVVYIFIISEAIYVGICLLTAGQYELLNFRLRHLLEEAILEYNRERGTDSVRNDSPGENEIFKHPRLQAILDGVVGRFVKHHQALLAFTEQLAKYLESILFIGLGYIMALIIFIAYIGVADSSPAKLTVLPNFAVVTARLLFDSFFGNLLSTKAEELLTALDEIPWYMCAQRFKRSYLIILKQCQLPVKLSAAKMMQIDLETFTKVMKTALSYFAVLRQMTVLQNDSRNIVH